MNTKWNADLFNLALVNFITFWFGPSLSSPLCQITLSILSKSHKQGRAKLIETHRLSIHFCDDDIIHPVKSRTTFNVDTIWLIKLIE